MVQHHLVLGPLDDVLIHTRLSHQPTMKKETLKTSFKNKDDGELK
jgi:hypothetical protein